MTNDIIGEKAERPTLGLTINGMKYIAIVAMTIDHIAHSFVPYESAFGVIADTIGMIAGTVMFYSAVEGYHHTRSLRNYLMRLAVFALISQLPFTFFMNGGSLNLGVSGLYLNVIYTIALGVLAIHVRRNTRSGPVAVLLVVGLVMLASFGDSGSMGVIIMLIFDCFYGDKKKQLVAYSFFAVVMLIISTNLHLFVIGIFAGGGYKFYPAGLSEIGLFLSLPLIKLYNGQRGSSGNFARWVFYIYYPLHFLILGIIKAVL